ncbi:BamA/TamA family outer membrane protein [Limibacter armeniacum]|uniref:BamA/TamA family outer membrane protein n=1 Tax=Limibacter armeniacum TaxID=466084 RepID=UPI002FE55AB4
MTCTIGIASAQNEPVKQDTTTNTKVVQEPYKAHNTYLPYAVYAPETSVEFGMFVLRQFKPKGAGDETRPSNVQLSGAYTLEKQYKITVDYSFLSPEEKWMSNGYITYRRFPEKYYGIGSDAKAENEQSIDWKSIIVEVQGLRKVKPSMFVGAQLRYVNMMDVTFEECEDCIDEPVLPLGAEGGVSAGIGAVYIWDTRDAILTPTKGHYIELSATTYGSGTGSDFSFTSIKFDARKYFDFSENTDGKSILALQTNIQQTYGDAPFREVALLGGGEMMRGYYQGRYRDNHLVAVQAEYRKYLFWRIGATVFGSAGNVASDWNTFEFSNLKAAMGAGLRLNLNKNDTANLRLDYGIGNGTSGLYMTFGEAF